MGLSELNGYYPAQKTHRPRESRGLSVQTESKVVGQSVGKNPALGGSKCAGRV
jgi:hypothetical protein